MKDTNHLGVSGQLNFVISVFYRFPIFLVSTINQLLLFSMILQIIRNANQLKTAADINIFSCFMAIQNFWNQLLRGEKSNYSLVHDKFNELICLLAQSFHTGTSKTFSKWAENPSYVLEHIDLHDTCMNHEASIPIKTCSFNTVY